MNRVHGKCKVSKVRERHKIVFMKYCDSDQQNLFERIFDYLNLF